MLLICLSALVALTHAQIQQLLPTCAQTSSGGSVVGRLCELHFRTSSSAGTCTAEPGTVGGAAGAVYCKAPLDANNRTQSNICGSEFSTLGACTTTGGQPGQCTVSSCGNLCKDYICRETTCREAAPCFLAGTQTVGVCTNAACNRQCSTSANSTCFLTVSSTVADGICVNSVCQQRAPAPPTLTPPPTPVPAPSSCTIGRPCGLANSTQLGICLSGFAGATCQPQCQGSSSTCFIDRSAQAADGVCDPNRGCVAPTTAASTTAATATPRPAPVCALGRPCSLPTGAVGRCDQVSTSGNVTCATQCPLNVKRQDAAPVCFLSLQSANADGVCQRGSCTPRIVLTPQPTPAPVATCQRAGTPCALSGAALYTGVGVCSQSLSGSNLTCAAQCGAANVKRQDASASCFLSLQSTSADGVCVQGRCSAVAVTPRPVPVVCTLGRPCALLNGAVGRCGQLSTSGNATCLEQCPLNVKRQTAAAVCFVSLQSTSTDGVCAQGRCTPTVVVSPTPRPVPSLCTVDRPCALLAGGASLVGRCALTSTAGNTTCAAQCNNLTKRQSAAVGCFLSIQSNGFDGVCVQGRCTARVVETTVKPTTAPSTPCFRVGLPCAIGSSIGVCNGNSATGGLVANGTCALQCGLVKRQDRPCFATLTSSTRDGVCGANGCVALSTGGDSCTVGRPCKTATVGISSTLGVCVAAGTATRCVDQCRDPNELRCFLSSASNSVDGVCRDGACQRPVVVPPTCVTPCRLLLSGANNTLGSAIGRCNDAGQCVAAVVVATCIEGAFCAAANNTRGVCRARVCAALECTNDEACGAGKLCQGYACADKPATQPTTRDACDSVRCQNGGKCTIVDATRAGLNVTQVKERTDVVFALGGQAAVCSCAAGFAGSVCEVQVNVDAGERAECKCGADATARDNRCVSRNSRVCDCNGANCRCTNGSTKDDCSLDAPSQPAPGQSRVVLSAVFSADRASLLQALATVQALLNASPNAKVQITAENTPQGFKVTVTAENVDQALIDAAKAAALELNKRSDVVDAVVVESDLVDAPAKPSGAETRHVLAALAVLAAVSLNL